MIKKYYSLFLLVMMTSFANIYAQDAPVLTYNIPAQNNVKYNRFLLNPAFSFVREDNTYISIYHRNQWVQYDDSPKVYMLAYTGRFSDRAGLGFGLYQQTLGVISSFGGIANYSYNVKIKQVLDVTLGFNLAYYNSGVDKNRTITEEPDPALMAMRNNSLLSIRPGLNVSWKEFDFGLFAENFIDYDFKSNKMATDYANKTYSGHIMYTHKMVTLKDIFEDSDFRLALREKTSDEYGFGLNASLLVNFPRIGWIQTGLDDYYGLGAGIGFHFTKRLSLGYTFERTTKEGLVNLGPTHEITMVFSFKDRTLAKQKAKPKTGKETLEKAKDTLAQKEEIIDEDTMAEEIAEAEEVADAVAADEAAAEETPAGKKAAAKKAATKADPDFDKKAELEKLKMDLDEESMHLLDALVKEDSVAQAKKAEFEQKVKNLKEYAKREKQTRDANKPIELKNLSPSKNKVKPKTLEDLKNADDGYYVVSKDINAKDDDKTILIEKHKTFTDAAIASEKKKASGKEKNVYVVHVDNTPDVELKKEITNYQTTLQNEKKLQNETADSLAIANGKSDNLKTEEEIKEFYSEKTDKPRETLKKMKQISVEGMEAGYYIIANVYSEDENVEKFVTKLKSRGINAGYFLNPKNNLRYVYLKKHSTWREALISYYSNVNNTYFDSIWIMSINTN